MTDTIEVSPDLMPTPGEGRDLQQGPPGKTIHHPKLCPAGAAPLSVNGNAARSELPERLIDHTLILRERSVDQCTIALLHLPGLELKVQAPVRFCCPRKEYDPAYVLVKPVHNVESAPELVGKEPLQKRAFLVPLPDRGNSLWLVDRQYVFLIKKDLNGRWMHGMLPAMVVCLPDRERPSGMSRPE